VPKTNSVVDLLDERQLIAIAAAHGIPRLPKVTHIAYKTAPAWRVKARREPKKEPTFETVAKKTKFWDAIFNEVRELVCKIAKCDCRCHSRSFRRSVRVYLGSNYSNRNMVPSGSCRNWEKAFCEMVRLDIPVGHRGKVTTLKKK
jgi:hypothetical protein